MKLRAKTRQEKKNQQQKEARERKRIMMGDAPKEKGRKPKYGN